MHKAAKILQEPCNICHVMQDKMPRLAIYFQRLAAKFVSLQYETLFRVERRHFIMVHDSWSIVAALSRSFSSFPAILKAEKALGTRLSKVLTRRHRSPM